jgi:hypothetical protein
MRRRKDPFDKPWVIIASVVGIIAVIIIALFFFIGGGSPVPEAGPGQSTSTTTSPQETVAVGVAPSVIITQVPVTVPADGVFIRVSYLGGFSGTYGMEGNMTTLRNSGDRVFAVDGATGTVSAIFQKEDASTRHEIVVEIYKDGQSRAIARNSSSYGEASVTYTV